MGAADIGALLQVLASQVCNRDNGRENGNIWKLLTWGYIGILGYMLELYKAHIGIMEKRMETTRGYRDYIGILYVHLQNNSFRFG